MSASPVMLRHLPVPDVEPALEEVPAPEPGWLRRQHAAGAPAGVQGVLTLVVDGDAPVDDFGPLPTATHALPDAEQWGRQMAQVIVEVISGHRPLTQLLRWTDAKVYAAVRAQTVPRTAAGRPARRRPRIGTVLVCQPADGVAEVSAVVHGQHRSQALAMRLEGLDGRWRVTVLQSA